MLGHQHIDYEEEEFNLKIYDQYRIAYLNRYTDHLCYVYSEPRKIVSLNGKEYEVPSSYYGHRTLDMYFIGYIQIHGLNFDFNNYHSWPSPIHVFKTIITELRQITSFKNSFKDKIENVLSIFFNIQYLDDTVPDIRTYLYIDKIDGNFKFDYTSCSSNIFVNNKIIEFFTIIQSEKLLMMNYPDSSNIEICFNENNTIFNTDELSNNFYELICKSWIYGSMQKDINYLKKNDNSHRIGDKMLDITNDEIKLREIIFKEREKEGLSQSIEEMINRLNKRKDNNKKKIDMKDEYELICSMDIFNNEIFRRLRLISCESFRTIENHDSFCYNMKQVRTSLYTTMREIIPIFKDYGPRKGFSIDDNDRKVIIRISHKFKCLSRCFLIFTPIRYRDKDGKFKKQVRIEFKFKFNKSKIHNYIRV